MKSTEILERIQIQRLLTSLAVDSLARTSALLEKVSELSVKEVAYGLRCIELYGKLYLDTSSLKTAQCSLFLYVAPIGRASEIPIPGCTVSFCFHGSRQYNITVPAPRFAGKHNELPDRVDRTECIGNAVQPIIAHYLFE